MISFIPAVLSECKETCETITPLTKSTIVPTSSSSSKKVSKIRPKKEFRSGNVEPKIEESIQESILGIQSDCEDLPQHVKEEVHIEDVGSGWTVGDDGDVINQENELLTPKRSPSPPPSDQNPATDTEAGSDEDQESEKSGDDDDESSEEEDIKKPRKKNERCALCNSAFKSFFDLDIHTKRVHLGNLAP